MPQRIPFTCRWSDSGAGAAWVHVAGDLNLATSSQLEATLLEAQVKADTVVLDLRGLTLGAPQVARVLALTEPVGGLDVFDLDVGARTLTSANETASAQA